MIPPVGTIVHYHVPSMPCMAAVITKVQEEETVALHVFWPPNTYHTDPQVLEWIRHDELKTHIAPSWHFVHSPI